ncbi:MAG: hypothetical protein ABIH52_04055 [Candidatus Aenigmatarchaeota archaeon]
MARKGRYGTVMRLCEQKVDERLYSLTDIIRMRENMRLQPPEYNGSEMDYYREHLNGSAVRLDALGVDLSGVNIRTAYRDSGVKRLLESMGG